METRGERESITVGSPGADSSTASLSLWSLRSDSSLCMTGPDVEEYCKQVFRLCDHEGKGYITREEIGQLCDRRNSVLDTLMTSLDTDNDGKISFEEFQAGFQAYTVVGGDPASSTPQNYRADSKDLVYESDPSGMGEASASWNRVLDRIDPDGLLKGTDAERVWLQLSQTDPSLLEQFEGFLVDMVEELKKGQQERNKLEIHVKRVRDQHSREVSEMEEILEQQISEVKEDQLAKSYSHTQRLSTQFEDLLVAREEEIKRVETQKLDLKQALEERTQSEIQLRQEREKLLLANEQLKDKLDTSSQQLTASRKAVKRLSVHECEDIDLKHDVQQQLVQDGAPPGSSPVRYFPPRSSPRQHHRQLGVVKELQYLEEEEEEAETDSETECPVIRRLFPQGSEDNSVKTESSDQMDFLMESNGHTPSQHDSQPQPVEGPHDGHVTQQQPVEGSHDSQQQPVEGPHDSHVISSPNHATVIPNHVTSNHASSPINRLTNHVLSCSTQQQPGILDASLTMSSWIPRRDDLPRPSLPSEATRVFKVVFLGNSGVGKTSLIVRLSEGQFRSSASATVGIDFTTKTLKIGEERVVFQLWDTAGQERFHNALTPVYFRRADAFVIIYDVTDKSTFKNVKSWVSIVTASLREHPSVLMLVGNKSDRGEMREVSLEEGRRHALELHALFSETSALSGDNVLQAHKTLASLLLARENEELEQARKTALQLSKQDSRKKKCSC